MKTNEFSQTSSINRNAIAGPLVVSKANPRYFAAASNMDQEAIYLTGSHIWNNFHDGMGPGPACAENAEVFDYDAYLQFLKERGHNFIRLWRWEQFKSQAAGGSFHLCMTPQPWARSGAGNARDGKPKYDLDSFDPAFFNRLRERVIAAANAGIYVAVMFFDGWALHLSPAPDNVEGHPFFGANNVNGVAIKSIVDYQVLPLDPRVQAFQEACVRKVIDTVHDLPNVLFEVANESSGGGSVDKEFTEALGLSGSPEWGDSTDWQYWVIDVVKRYQQQMGYHQHPIGMTMQFPVAEQIRVNHPLFNGPADWISPGYDDEIFNAGQHPMAPGSPPSHWYDNPPASEGKKVVITDTDHYAPGQGDALWAWKSFLRGHHPILMDFGIIDLQNRLDPAFQSFEPARYAMGDTRRFAERVKLIEMEPRSDLSSTGYVLANPGEEYLILQPSESAEAFTVELAAGSYTVEWYRIDSRETAGAGKVTVEIPAPVKFNAPFEKAGAAILYLHAV